VTATVFTVRTPPLLCNLYWFIYRLAEDIYPMVAVRHFMPLQCQVARRSRPSIQRPKAWMLVFSGRPCKQPSTFLSRRIWFQFDLSWLWYLYKQKVKPFLNIFTMTHHVIQLFPCMFPPCLCAYALSRNISDALTSVGASQRFRFTGPWSHQTMWMTGFVFWSWFVSGLHLSTAIIPRFRTAKSFQARQQNPVD
jgi:hypothetical protein